MNIITYEAKRNTIGQFVTSKFTKVKKIVKVTTKVLVLTYLAVSFISLFVSYYTLKTNYVLTCKANIGGIDQNWKLGHFMNKRTCDDLIQDRILANNKTQNEYPQ